VFLEPLIPEDPVCLEFLKIPEDLEPLECLELHFLVILVFPEILEILLHLLR
jgi:hypothetical protein